MWGRVRERWDEVLKRKNKVEGLPWVPDRPHRRTLPGVLLFRLGGFRSIGRRPHRFAHRPGLRNTAGNAERSTYRDPCKDKVCSGL